MTHLIVIGGGIAGLSAAYYASKNENIQVTLLESDSRWGGKITTDRVEFEDSQFIIEGGPDAFLASKPWGVALCQELDLSERLQETNPHKKDTYVLHNNRLLPLPDGLTMMIPGKINAILQTRLLSWLSKARLGLDFFLPAKSFHGDESLDSFVSRRLGREAYENLIEPLMTGIYAGDGNKLSLAATFPQLRELERKYGSLTRGALEMRKQITQGSRSAFLTPKTGLLEIVEKLIEHLNANRVSLCLNTRVNSVQWFTHNWQVTLESGEILMANGVILATPAYNAGQILSSLDSSLALDLESIPYASTATISLAYRQSDIPRELDGYGYVIPRREGRRALACTWTSTKFPHRAPQGYGLIRVFIGRADQELLWKEEELLILAKEELNLTLGITADPFLFRVFIWEKAMPQYNLGHPEILQRIDAALNERAGLALAGNGYRGIGIPDCIHSGKLAVEKVMEAIGLVSLL
jgi:oxygen-dependent protoporphyrinogen oxidase